jgi:SAM-dependent methyltransferase
LKTRFYPESRFGGFTDSDGTIAFYLRVAALLEPSFTVLDFGCGRGAYTDDPLRIRRELRIFKDRAARVIGLDTDPAAESNPFLDRFHLLENDFWPVEDETADLIVCDHVLEHLPSPTAFFAEAYRTLKPGGYLCIRTPNAWGYPALASRLIPTFLHLRVLKRAKERLKPQDVFLTYYRCNTLPAIRHALRAHAFDGIVYGFRAEPSYLAFSPITYWLGVLYQRFAPGFLCTVLFSFSCKGKI